MMCMHFRIVQAHIARCPRPAATINSSGTVAFSMGRGIGELNCRRRYAMASVFTCSIRSQSLGSSSRSSCEKRNSRISASVAKSSRRQSITESPRKMSRIDWRSASVNSLSGFKRSARGCLTSFIAAGFHERWSEIPALNARWRYDGKRCCEGEGTGPALSAFGDVGRVGRAGDRGVPAERQRSHEDAKRDRQNGALTEKGARTAGNGDGGHGHDVPGGQLHCVNVSARMPAESPGERQRDPTARAYRYRASARQTTCKRSYDIHLRLGQFLSMWRGSAQDKPFRIRRWSTKHGAFHGAFHETFRRLVVERRELTTRDHARRSNSKHGWRPRVEREAGERGEPCCCERARGARRRRDDTRQELAVVTKTRACGSVHTRMNVASADRTGFSS